MASSQKTVDFLVDQMSDAGSVSARKMFGEYAVYCDNKVVALVCDDRLFVKPTAQGREFAGPLDEVPPYNGAKPCLLVPPDRWEDRAWLSKLARLTAASLPSPKKKKTNTPASTKRRA